MFLSPRFDSDASVHGADAARQGKRSVDPLAAEADAGEAVLSVGTDERLLATRAGVLGITGRNVISAYPAEVSTLLRTYTFRVVVICHTVSNEEAAAVALETHAASPRIRLLATCREPRPADSLFDLVLESRKGPVALLAGVCRLLEETGA